MQEIVWQSQVRQLSIEQEKLHWAPQAHKSWIAFGDKSTKHFQMVATIRKRHNTIRKIKDEHEYYFNDQNEILQVFLNFANIHS